MGRDRKLSNPDITSKIDLVAIQYPQWGSRKISKELKATYGISLSHTKVNEYLSGKDEGTKNHIAITKIIPDKVEKSIKKNVPNIQVKEIPETEFMNIQQVFNSNEVFLSAVMSSKDVDLMDKLRAAAIRYQNAGKYSMVTGKGLSAKEAEKYKSLIDDMEQERKIELDKLLVAIKETVPEKYFAQIAEVL